jgi:Tfp pilus assembly protein PilE
MSLQYLTQRKQIIDQVFTGLDLSEKSHLISFEKIQRLLFEALQDSKSTPESENTLEPEVASNSHQSLQNYLLPQFQLLVENCKFAKKYLNIRQRLNIERIRNIDYADTEYSQDLDNLKQLGKKYKKEIEEICLAETLNLFTFALNKPEYRELFSVGAGSPDEYQVRKYIREKVQGESSLQHNQFVKEVEKFLQEKFQDEVILQAKEATKSTMNFFFQIIQANQELDVSRLSKDVVQGGIETIANQKFEYLIQEIVNQVILLYQSYVKSISDTQVMQDDTLILCLLGAMERFFQEKKAIYDTDYIQVAITNDVESLLPKSLENSVKTLLTATDLTPIEKIKNLKILAREVNPSMAQIMNSTNKLYSETPVNEISLVYVDASDELSKEVSKASKKLINSGDARTVTYKFTLTPRKIEDEAMKYTLFYGSREEKQSTFKSILSTKMKELNEEISEENIATINFLDQFQTLYLEVVFVKNNGQLVLFTEEQLNLIMKNETFIKSELTPIFKYLQLDPTMIDTEFSQRLNNSPDKKMFESFSCI